VNADEAVALAESIDRLAAKRYMTAAEMTAAAAAARTLAAFCHDLRRGHTDPQAATQAGQMAERLDAVARRFDGLVTLPVTPTRPPARPTRGTRTRPPDHGTKGDR